VVVDAEGRRGRIRAEGAGGVDQRRPLVFQQAEIAGFRLQAEQQAGLVDDVDVLLQPVGDAAVQAAPVA